MADERFDLVFRGDIVLGQPLASVKQRLQQLFKADEAKIEQLFTGRPVALKRQLDAATAKKYQQVLHKAGAQVEMVPSQARQAKAEAAPTRGLSLAPVGGLLLKPSERARLTPVSVDTSGLSLRPPEGDLLDRTERRPEEPMPVAIPDFVLAEVGADLLEGSERDSLPLASVDPEDWGLAEAGSDLLSASERAPEPPPVAVPEFDVAPVGSEMGELKKNQAPVAPDISGLTLEEPKP
ncbi:hypothetical protein [Marinimicrobium agarilyticum]|uniref:hypothetical protein n=1 Tax=Marinimicrobium agarilyticum TaxID=306546 RepID=UPI00040CA147|nr:hypothetical protein [Marinimicrobium agarilyticum]